MDAMEPFGELWWLSWIICQFISITSTQIPEFQTWLDESNQAVAENNNKKIVELIPQLAAMINKVLEEQSFKDQIYVHIYVLRYMVDDEVRAVELSHLKRASSAKFFTTSKDYQLD